MEPLMKILVTAGPTREPIDKVRFISNRSSGRTGYAIAAAAFERNHDVRLVSGPVNVCAASGIDVIDVETAAEMRDTVLEQVSWFDCLIMCAAVSDFCPLATDEAKIKRTPSNIMLEMVPTADILSEVSASAGSGQILIGFALEPEERMMESARNKLSTKGLDMIVANSFETIGNDTIQGAYIFRDQSVEEFDRMIKPEFSRQMVIKAETLFNTRRKTEDE